MIGDTAGVSLKFIADLGERSLNVRSEALRSALETSQGENVGPAQMMSLQMQMQQWTLLITTISTVFKDTTDAMKGVVQKSS
jgi:hypothetical protein